MNIQIYGFDKCFDTKKAQRYFKERKIKFQYINLNIVALSKRELESVKASVGLMNLFNKECKEYERLNVQKLMNASVKEELILNNPKLYKTPIVRNGKNATVGFEPEIWKNWE